MIPDYQTLMLPVLKAAAENEVSTREVIDKLANEYELSVEDREQLLPSGKQRTFDNRVHWAKGYLKQAGLVRYTKRGSYIATDEGRKVLAQNPGRLDNSFLKKFESFQEFQNRKGTQSAGGQVPDEPIQDANATPDEILRAAHRNINASLAADLLDRVREASPQFFEELIIQLLLAMGYGGTSEDAARALGQSGDNGVDGVVDQDPLGVDQIYVQAKRYAEGNNIGDKELSATDLKKLEEGKDSSIDRTRRLLYVTCSRAERSLALVVYAENPEAVKAHVIDHGWFIEDEVNTA